ncbi:MAG: hypothetical protein PHX35_04545, partial [Candidatus Bipolaricaulis anaerobius]|nr:hypothetical protein [Candidatus Bipolaricaulis anaerobius]
MKRFLLVVAAVALAAPIALAQGLVPIVDATPFGQQTVNPGQRFLAQKITITNNGTTAITLKSVTVQNIYGTSTERVTTHWTKIEVKQGTTSLGTQDNPTPSLDLSGTAGVTVTLSSPRNVAARGTVTLEIYVTLAPDPDLLANSYGIRLQSKATYVTPPGNTTSTTTTTAPSAGYFLVEPRARNDGTLPSGYVHVGAEFCAQRIIVNNRSSEPITIRSLTVKNSDATAVPGTQVAKIAVRRGTAIIGEEPVGSDEKFTGGVTIYTSLNNTVAATTAATLEIWVTLKSTAGAGKRLKLTTTVTHLDYPEAGITANAVFQVELLGITDDPVTLATVYPGQRFLAQRVDVDNSRHGAFVTLNSVAVRNTIPTPPQGSGLTGAYLAKIEVVRASDGMVLGQETSPGKLANFNTDGAVVAISTGAYNRVEAYGWVKLEIWITLKSDA